MIKFYKDEWTDHGAYTRHNIKFHTFFMTYTFVKWLSIPLRFPHNFLLKLSFLPRLTSQRRYNEYSVGQGRTHTPAATAPCPLLFSSFLCSWDNFWACFHCFVYLLPLHQLSTFIWFVWRKLILNPALQSKESSYGKTLGAILIIDLIKSRFNSFLNFYLILWNEIHFNIHQQFLQLQISKANSPYTWQVQECLSIVVA